MLMYGLASGPLAINDLLLRLLVTYIARLSPATHFQFHEKGSNFACIHTYLQRLRLHCPRIARWSYASLFAIFITTIGLDVACVLRTQHEHISSTHFAMKQQINYIIPQAEFDVCIWCNLSCQCALCTYFIWMPLRWNIRSEKQH